MRRYWPQKCLLLISLSLFCCQCTEPIARQAGQHDEDTSPTVALAEYRSLVISTDNPAKILIDGVSKTDIRPEESLSVDLPRGEYLIEAISDYGKLSEVADLSDSKLIIQFSFADLVKRHCIRPLTGDFTFANPEAESIFSLFSSMTHRGKVNSWILQVTDGYLHLLYRVGKHGVEYATSEYTFDENGVLIAHLQMVSSPHETVPRYIPVTLKRSSDGLFILNNKLELERSSL